MSEDLEKQFIGLLEAHTGIVYKITRVYASDPEDEKDLRQEVIYQAWRSFPHFKGKARFSTWLYRLALNTALTHVRKERPSTHAQANWSSEALTDDTREWLIQHIRRFSAIEKLVIMLHLDGYPNEEIAQISGLTKNHVAVKLHRIKAQLTEHLKKQSS